MRPYHSRSVIAVGAAALLLLSCDGGPASIAGPAETTADQDLRRRVEQVSLVSCAPLAADSVTQAVGAAGGVIAVGPHRLRIPAGALDSTVAITAIMPSDTVARVRFLPEGLTFAQSATVELSYGHCVLAWVPVSRRVVYVDELLDILDILVSLTNVFRRTVSAPVDHFSDYAVAW
jgi:hypothetical protein